LIEAFEIIQDFEPANVIAVAVRLANVGVAAFPAGAGLPRSGGPAGYSNAGSKHASFPWPGHRSPISSPVQATVNSNPMLRKIHRPCK